MDYKDHLAWSKERALDILKGGDIPGAYASMVSDLNDHPQGTGHPAFVLGMQLLAGGHLDTAAKMEKFINDFN